MFAFFLLPATMALGGAAVSVPVVIHLINRMRFRRIRWAAMEFLLRSQKRNRRRLIIEQLLLLLLRCALVVLLAVLLARFVGWAAGFGAVQTTTHVVVLDDTLSMTDQWKDQGATKTAFEEGKRLIKEIARNAAQAGAAQQFQVVTLSDPSKVVFDSRLNEQALDELSSTLDGLKPTDLHVPPQVGIQAGRELLGGKPAGQRILHFIGDFRSQDWSGPEADALNQEIDSLCQTGAQVYLVDAADPTRGGGNQVPLHHDNLGIVDLRAETRVAAKGMPVQFTVTVMNFGKEKRENVFLTVRVNGAERLEGSQPIPVLPANSLTTHTFQVAFVQDGFNQVTASLAQDDVGIEDDNKRFAVIEVRPEVEVLMVDGSGALGQKPGGDTFYLQTVLTSARGYKVVPRGVEELERPLDKYPSVYLLNVKELSDKALKNLENYVRDGGKVAVFVGDNVRPGWYNTRFYDGGKGLFPVPLADRPSEPLTPEQKIQKLLLDDQQKLFLRSKDHPIFADIYPVQSIFRYLVIDRYWPAQRRDRWANEPGAVQELATLPNETPLENFRASGNDLNGRIEKLLDDPKYEKFAPGLRRHHAAIRDALAGNQLYVLANELEALLNDEGNLEKPDPNRPNLKKDFWEQPEVQGLRQDVDQFRQVVQFGDPLVLDKRYGKGHVVAFLTTAGKAWSDWPGGCPASPTYPIAMMMLQKYLTSGGDDLNRTVCTPLHLPATGQELTPAGSPVKLELDATRYQDRMDVYYQPEVSDVQAPQQPAAPATGAGKHPGLTGLGEQRGTTKDGKRLLTFDGARQPGVYLIDLYPVAAEAGGEPKPETRAYAFNVDTLAEGELARAPREDLEHNPANPPPDRGRIYLYNAHSDYKALTQRQHDLSESPWLFLAFLVVLVLEQALAVHLSFHLRGNEAQLPPAVRPTPSAAA